MSAPYRLLQSDFSGGQIDPMAAANLNMGARMVGLRESLNTVHNTTRTVSKRPGTMKYTSSQDMEGFLGQDGTATMQLANGKSVMFIFAGSYLYANYDGVAQEIHLPDVVQDWEAMKGGPYKIACYQNFLYVVGPRIRLAVVLMITAGAGQITATEIRGRWGVKPSCAQTEDVSFSSVCLANGRLFLTRENVVYASRIRVAGTEGLVEDSDGFPRWTLDFRLYDEVTTVDSEGNPFVTKEIYASHAIEVRENDMYSSRIQWIANMGRIIVGTESAIFMSTSQEISPLSFDLVLTSSYGSCEIQPTVVSNMLLFIGSDRRKIHFAYFNSDNAGLVVGDASAERRNLFSGFVKGIWAFDYPELSVYVITEDRRMLFSQPVYSDTGLMFGWSEWDFPGFFPTAFFIERRTEQPYNRICMSYERFGSVAGDQFLTICWEAPYDDSTARPKMDLMVTQDDPDLDMHIGLHQVTINCPLHPEGCTAFIYAENVAPMVFRNNRGGEVHTFTIPGEIEGLNSWVITVGGSQYPDENTFYNTKVDALAVLIETGLEGEITGSGRLRTDLKITVGLEYETRIGLFQQLLPNNSGVALTSKHRIREISLSLFRSFGGSLEVAGRKVEELQYLKYGHSFYSASMYDFATKGAYQYTGAMRITNPRYMGLDADNQDRDVLEEDKVVIVADGPFPFNLMAVSINYILTEVM